MLAVSEPALIDVESKLGVRYGEARRGQSTVSRKLDCEVMAIRSINVDQSFVLLEFRSYPVVRNPPLIQMVAIAIVVNGGQRVLGFGRGFSKHAKAQLIHSHRRIVISISECARWQGRNDRYSLKGIVL